MSTNRNRRGDDFARQRLFRVVGLATIAVIGLVSWVSYHALHGLPFQSSYDVSVRLPNAQRLIATDDVRIGGVRVGQVASVGTQPGTATAPPFAIARLRLDPSVGPLPSDTRAQVRSASVLGATYVALTPGSSRRTIPRGGALPLSQASGSPELSDLFQIFKGSAARSFREATAGFSAGLAGQGPAINATLSWYAQLMPPVTRVARAVASREADLQGFIAGTDAFGRALAPAGSELRGMFSGGARTFTGLASERGAMGAAIQASPPTELAATEALQRVRPGLRSFSQLMTQTRRATPLMAPAFRALDGAVTAGVLPLRRVPGFANGLRSALATLTTISRVPSIDGGVRKIGELAAAGSQALTTMLPAQLRCNIFSLFFRNFAAFTGVMGFDQGPSLGPVAITNPGNSTDGEQAKEPAPDAHIDYTPREDLTSCDAGNEPWKPNTQKLGPPDQPTGGQTLATTPPPGVLDRARAAGLLAQVDR